VREEHLVQRGITGIIGCSWDGVSQTRGAQRRVEGAHSRRDAGRRADAVQLTRKMFILNGARGGTAVDAQSL
jgi:hypothetical protein